MDYAIRNPHSCLHFASFFKFMHANVSATFIVIRALPYNCVYRNPWFSFAVPKILSIVSFLCEYSSFIPSVCRKSHPLSWDACKERPALFHHPKVALLLQEFYGWLRMKVIRVGRNWSFVFFHGCYKGYRRCSYFSEYDSEGAGGTYWY